MSGPHIVRSHSHLPSIVARKVTYNRIMKVQTLGELRTRGTAKLLDWAYILYLLVI